METSSATPSPLLLPQIVTETFTPHWREDLTAEQYHADKSAVSSSSLKLMHKSAKTFFSTYTDTQPKKDPDHFRLGRAAHCATYEPQEFDKRFVRIPDLDLRTKEGKMKRKEFEDSLAPGAAILTESEYANLCGMVESVMAHSDASGLISGGKPEISGFYRDSTTGIKCKFRPDCLDLDLMMISDLKTTSGECSFDEFQREMLRRRYDLSMAMYCHGVRQLVGKAIEEAFWVVVEKQKPYEVAVYRLHQDVLTKGMNDYLSAMDKLKRCLITGQWSPYQESNQTMTLPPWAVS